MLPQIWFSARMTIPGFFYVLALFFLLLKWLNVDNLKFLENYRSFEPYASSMVIVSSYVIGSLMNTLLVTIFDFVFSIFKKVLLLVEKLFSIRRALSVESKNNTKAGQEVMWLKHDRNRLIEERSSKYSYMLLFRSLTVSVFCFGLSLSSWLQIICVELSQWSNVVAFIALFSFAIAFLKLRCDYKEFCNAADRQIQKGQIKKITNHSCIN